MAGKSPTIPSSAAVSSDFTLRVLAASHIVSCKPLELCYHELVRETWPVELVNETAMAAVAGARPRQQGRPGQTRGVGDRNHRIVLREQYGRRKPHGCEPLAGDGVAIEVGFEGRELGKLAHEPLGHRT